MDRPQFKTRKLRPMQPEQYRRAADDLRRVAARLEASADPRTPAERASRTKAVAAAWRVARALLYRDRCETECAAVARSAAHFDREVEARVAERMAQREANNG